MRARSVIYKNNNILKGLWRAVHFQVFRARLPREGTRYLDAVAGYFSLKTEQRDGSKPLKKLVPGAYGCPKAAIAAQAALSLKAIWKKAAPFRK